MLFFAWLLLGSCSLGKEQGSTTKQLFGFLEDGSEVYQYELKNPSDASVSIINFGGIITSIKVPDRSGVLTEVVLGFDSLASYQKRASFGAIIGRYANRISNAAFELDGITYTLEKNNGPNNLHSGSASFNREVWEVTDIIRNATAVGTRLKLVSPHMDDGFPGQLTSFVTYLWTNDNALEIQYEATTDQKTVLNFTNHSYFNLANNEDPILDHELLLKASHFLPVDENLIPTGEIRAVSQTPFDFTRQKPVGKDIDDVYPQIIRTGGYDHCWVIDGWNKELRSVGYLYAPVTGIKMEVMTSEPGIQIYTANGLTGKGRGNTAFVNRGAVCLETQHFPDSPNKPAFPSTILNVGDQFSSKTIYKFSVKQD